MEKIDYELLRELAPDNLQLRQLYQKHAKLEREVERFSRYAPYSSSAALKKQELKKQKLIQKERILSYLDKHKIAANG